MHAFIMLQVTCCKYVMMCRVKRDSPYPNMAYSHDVIKTRVMILPG